MRLAPTVEGPWTKVGLALARQINGSVSLARHCTATVVRPDSTSTIDPLRMVCPTLRNMLKSITLVDCAAVSPMADSAEKSVKR